MNCRKNLYSLLALPQQGGGGVRDEHFKVTRPKQQVLNSVLRMQLS